MSCGIATCKLDVLETARDLAELSDRTLPCSAVSSDRDFLAVCVDEFTHSEQDLGAPLDSDVDRHAGNAAWRRGNSGIDFGDRSEIDRAGLSSGRWVIDRSRVA